MTPSRSALKRTLVATVAIVGVLVISSGSWLLVRRPVFEWLYLRQLTAEDISRQREAVDGLIQLGSRELVVRLLDASRFSQDEERRRKRPPLAKVPGFAPEAGGADAGGMTAENRVQFKRLVRPPHLSDFDPWDPGSDWIDQSLYVASVCLRVGKPALDPLLSELARPESDFDARCLFYLCCLGADAVLPLTRILEEPEGDLVLRVLRVLHALGPTAKETLPQVLPFARDRNSEFALVALKTLLAIDGSDPRVLPALVRAAETGAEDVSEFALKEIESRSACDKAAVLALERLVLAEAAPQAVRLNAVTALAERGGPEDSSITDLLVVVDAVTPEGPRQWAEVFEGRRWSLSLEGLGPCAFDSVLDALSRSSSRVLRASAISAFNHFASRASAAASCLGSALQDPRLDVRLDACEALRRLGIDAAPVLPALEAAMADRAPQLRLSATRALEAIGAKASASAPALLSALSAVTAYSEKGAADFEAQSHRCALIDALACVAPARPEVLERFGALVEDRDALVRISATYGLLRAGELSRPFERKLQVAMGSPHSALALVSALAVARLGGEVTDLSRRLRAVFSEVNSLKTIRYVVAIWKQVREERGTPPLASSEDDVASDDLRSPGAHHLLQFLEAAMPSLLQTLAREARESEVGVLLEVLRAAPMRTAALEKAAASWLRTSDDRVFWEAVCYLCDSEDGRETLIRELPRSLSNSEPRCSRRRLIWAVQELGPDASRLLPLLKDQLCLERTLRKLMTQ